MNEPLTTSGTRRKPNLWERLRDFFLRLSIWNRIALLFLLIVPLMAYGGLKLLRPVYSSWKANNSLKIAGKAIERDDMKAASLAFRTAIQTQPSDPKVWRRVGEFLDESGSPESFSVWQRVVELDPDDLDARFALIKSAVAAKRLESADEALAELPDSARQTERYHRAAASIAMAKNNLSVAEEQLTALLAINPEADDAQWDLVRIRSISPDPETRSQAREDLRAYGEGNGPYSLDALRQLVRLSLSEKDFYTANRAAEGLIAHADATGQDQILHLDTEFAVQSFTLPLSISNILDYAAANPESAPEVTAYLSARGLNDRVLAWFEQLDPEVLNQQSVQLAEFNYSLKVGDWTRLFEILRGENSPHPFSEELVNEVETSLDDYRRGDSGSLPEWKKAVFTAENNPSATYVMATLAQAVDWKQAYSLALWSLASSVGQRAEIWMEVLKMELADGNSAGILRALAGAIRADPDNRQLRNDWVLMNLLLEKGNLPDLLELARGNAEYDPSNAYYTTTYGLALALSGDFDEAVNVVQSLPKEEQEQPEKSLYVGSILAMAGRAEEAKPFLALAEQATDKFLPEEQSMRKQAESLVSGGSSRESQIQQITQRHEMSEEERAEFVATLRSQTDSDGEGADSTGITESLRQTAEADRRSPEEIQRLLEDIRQTSAPDVEETESTEP